VRDEDEHDVFSIRLRVDPDAVIEQAESADRVRDVSTGAHSEEAAESKDGRQSDVQNGASRSVKVVSGSRIEATLSPCSPEGVGGNRGAGDKEG
jgi:hypothetical protein